MVKKIALFWMIGAVISLYTTFVLQNLWNWFVTEAFHLSQVSFWVMYGLVLVVGMFSDDLRFDENQQFKALATALDACIPEEKREWVNEQLDTQTKFVWLEAGSAAFGRLVGTTFTLLVAWVVHVFLA